MKVVIAGYGVEGESSYRYWSNLGHEITIADQKQTPAKPLPAGALNIIGDDAFERLNGFDLVIRTASLPPHAIATDGKVWSAANEFFAKCPAPIIGVTGTKGKGTTSSFIASILRAAGKKVHLLGNIGKPSLDVLPGITETDVVVYELSSFQLWDLQRSPHVAVVLMIEPDHLEVHESFEEYVSAKGNIARWQHPSDVVIFFPDNEFSGRIAEQSAGTKLPFTRSPGAYVKGDSFWVGEQKVCSTETVVIPGNHNLDNACAAITAAWQFTHDIDAIERGLGDFKGLPHRLKFVRETRGVKFYDDSIATTPGSAIAAVRAFKQPKVVILGGSSKGAEFGELAETLANANVRKALLIGAEAPKIANSLNSKGFHNYENLGDSINMKGIVGKAAEVAENGDIVILSPACASFGMFENYKVRGEQFIEAVTKL